MTNTKSILKNDLKIYITKKLDNKLMKNTLLVKLKCVTFSSNCSFIKSHLYEF